MARHAACCIETIIASLSQAARAASASQAAWVLPGRVASDGLAALGIPSPIRKLLEATL